MMHPAIKFLICGAVALGPPAQALMHFPQDSGLSNSPPRTSSATAPVGSQKTSQASPGTDTKSQAATVHKKKRRRKAAAQPAKTVVSNGSTPDPHVQFSTAGTPEQASHERENTAGLLATTNSNLQKLSGQTLNPTQEDTVKQIHTYMQQAKTAEDTGDLQSAHNLALKAQLLSKELVRP